MPDITKWIDQGLGIASFVALIGLVVFYVKSVKPALEALQVTNATFSEIIKNNTSAIKEVSRSNDNVAGAIALLNGSIEQNTTILAKHDVRAESMQISITRIDERTSACLK